MDAIIFPLLTLGASYFNTYYIKRAIIVSVLLNALVNFVKLDEYFATSSSSFTLTHSYHPVNHLSSGSFQGHNAYDHLSTCFPSAEETKIHLSSSSSMGAGEKESNQGLINGYLYSMAHFIKRFTQFLLFFSIDVIYKYIISPIFIQFPKDVFYILYWIFVWLVSLCLIAIFIYQLFTTKSYSKFSSSKPTFSASSSEPTVSSYANVGDDQDDGEDDTEIGPF